MSSIDFEPEPALPKKPSALITPALWGIGVALQLAAPLLRDNVSLSDDLLINSIFIPVWTFLQLSLLAGALALLRRPAEGWSSSAKVMFGGVVAVLVMTLQPYVIGLAVSGGDVPPLGSDPVNLALLWSAPLTFYVIPAGILLWAWIQGPKRMTLPRALGISLIYMGVVNFGFIMWCNYLWRMYIEPQGGESVLRLAPGLFPRA